MSQLLLSKDRGFTNRVTTKENLRTIAYAETDFFVELDTKFPHERPPPRPSQEKVTWMNSLNIRFP